MTQPKEQTAYRRLNPLTKLLAALVVTAAALVTSGMLAPALLVVVGVLAPATAARTVSTLVRTALLLTLPLAVSILLVNVLFFPGGREVIFSLGPVRATAEGLAFAIETLLRLAAISGAITLFYLTTPPGELALDLEHRGVPARLTFIIHAAVQMVPAMVERAEAITAAQRARGLDTEGSLWKRLRGVLPLAGPVLLGSIAEVEERTMALEARGFTRPGRRTLLWHPPDSSRQALVRWLLVAAVPALVAARASGLLDRVG
ncbi:MAG TPA: energy-coupling factor transporter transmembrane component T [Candidatus Limnocylindria bacterium]|nr:energy-coupling factor transporter transmembrane component T [Candidatus Limnocylindria bacterium]